MAKTRKKTRRSSVELENLVMEAVGTGALGKDVQGALYGKGIVDRTSSLKVLKRLTDNGALTRSGQRGKYFYRPGRGGNGAAGVASAGGVGSGGRAQRAAARVRRAADRLEVGEKGALARRLVVVTREIETLRQEQEEIIKQISSDG